MCEEPREKREVREVGEGRSCLLKVSSAVSLSGSAFTSAARGAPSFTPGFTPPGGMSGTKAGDAVRNVQPDSGGRSKRNGVEEIT